MTVLNAASLAIVAVAVIGPLAREYVEFRREWGLGPLAAALASLTLFPALGFGLAVSAPLADTPAFQWLATIVVTIAAYSLATAALRSARATEAPRRLP
jgi:arginine exporter protein ArgO